MEPKSQKKSLEVQYDTWKKLSLLKIKWDINSVDDVINKMMEDLNITIKLDED